MNILSGTAAELPVAVMAKMPRYRHRVFIDKLKWDLPTKDDNELDQFDHSDTVYVVSQDDQENLTGVARLLRTDRPYLLSEVFPHLLNGLAPPQSTEIWELSRFTTLDFNKEASAAPGCAKQWPSPTALALLRAAIAAALDRGAKRLITVSPLAIERLIRRSGFHAHRAGPPMIVDNHPVLAIWIELDNQSTQQRPDIANQRQGLTNQNLQPCFA